MHQSSALPSRNDVLEEDLRMERQDLRRRRQTNIDVTHLKSRCVVLGARVLRHGPATRAHTSKQAKIADEGGPVV